MAQVLSACARQAWPPSVSADKEQLLLVGLLEERYAVIVVSHIPRLLPMPLGYWRRGIQQL